MKLTSTAFQDNTPIPSKYTCDGENVNPPLTFSKVPMDAQSLVLIVEDPDAPSGTFTHWLIYNIPSSTIQILEDENPENSTMGVNDFGRMNYGGPCPPSGTHRYLFKLFALNKTLSLDKGLTKEEVLEEMDGKIIETAELVGLYKR